MERVICIAIGYVFGLFQTSFIYGKLNKVDIRDYGSGNAGTTNAMRVLGKKAGIITFLGDCLKAVFAMLLIGLIFSNVNQELLFVLKIYCGLGVVLGHNFPFYMGFKGGKGIAATGGVIIGIGDWKLLLLGLLTFASVTLISKYVSLGSLCLLTGFLIEVIVFNRLGILGFQNDYQIKGRLEIELYVLVFIFTALAFYKHRENIKRLLSGTERKIGEKKDKLNQTA